MHKRLSKKEIRVNKKAGRVVLDYGYREKGNQALADTHRC